ncbi:hypothetical protein JK364_52030 [Streptomyces sp. 110]|uniref:Uncharacterized protein n=1 Tax=Streptomyces endocoffeicus TaxID=2898945 RepID=A0ABS1Q8P8_9ACTN|nr:hypothetical protein [Streptomyces endocoffeicus]MBL1120735.1 hypothetical protein [Streptomyces endocoffeicus]
MPDYSALGRQEQREAQETRGRLASFGVFVSVFQVAKAEEDVSAWHAGRLSSALLCAKNGWELGGLRPEFGENKQLGRVVYLSQTTFTEVVGAARQRTEAGQPTLLGYKVADGVRHMPVITVLRRSRTSVEQLLTGRAGEYEDFPGLRVAELPVNRPHDREHGVPCALCDVYGAQRLRRDQRRRPGLVCDDCADTLDMTIRMWPMHLD